MCSRCQQPAYLFESINCNVELFFSLKVGDSVFQYVGGKEVVKCLSFLLLLKINSKHPDSVLLNLSVS